MSERSEFKYFAFYKRQKRFLAKGHSGVQTVSCPAATTPYLLFEKILDVIQEALLLRVHLIPADFAELL